jgi:hypothetical protein
MMKGYATVPISSISLSLLDVNSKQVNKRSMTVSQECSDTFIRLSLNLSPGI